MVPNIGQRTRRGKTSIYRHWSDLFNVRINNASWAHESCRVFYSTEQQTLSLTSRANSRSSSLLLMAVLARNGRSTISLLAAVEWACTTQMRWVCFVLQGYVHFVAYCWYFCSHSGFYKDCSAVLIIIQWVCAYKKWHQLVFLIAILTCL